MIRVFSSRIRQIPHIEWFLESAVLSRFHFINYRNITAAAGWGAKKSGQKASRYAEARGIPFLSLEDGFLRSVGLGTEDSPLSIAVDDLGIYYDATRPSRLEALASKSLTSKQERRTQLLISRWCHGRVSKYNHLREYSSHLPTPYVLVADQTFGDASIHCGMAQPESFERMLEAALVENPHSTVVVKIHPDVFAGKKRGHFDVEKLLQNSRINVLAEDVHPVGIIEHAEAVYAVTSQMGFEGLLWGKRVRTFGMPFYAGWGLTQDELAPPERRHNVSLEQLVHAALIDYPRYVSPESGTRCEVEEIIEHVALQRRMRGRFPSVVYALGFSLYKRSIVRRYFWGSELRFVRRLEQVPADSTLAVWGGRSFAEGSADSSALTVIRLEDGFVRSVGLGADLIQPLSWVMDQRGIYFDARQPSDLECILQSADFDDSLIHRASRLCQKLVSEGLTKYNVGLSGWNRPDRGEARKGVVILVPGQVETDASLAFGAPNINKNMDLLRAVRQANPDAYVVYKPHPDVLAGLRKSGQLEGEAKQWCDELLTDVSMGELLLQVDELHTLTSLAGFEALLRGKKVVCYGQPFYSGWGLTTDIYPVERRSRQLSLNALIAGVLILYPTCVSRVTGRFTSPEQALRELITWRAREDGHLSWWRRMLRVALQLRKT